MTDMFTIHCPETGSSSGPWTLPEVAEVLATVHAVFDHEGAHTIELVEDFESECTCLYRTSYCLNCPVSVEPEPAKPDHDWARLRRLETEFLGLDTWEW